MNAMMMERMGMSGTQGLSVPGMGTPGTMPAASNWTMVPRCTVKFEKCQGGMKVTCVCDDPMARSAAAVCRRSACGRPGMKLRVSEI